MRCRAKGCKRRAVYDCTVPPRTRKPGDWSFVRAWCERHFDELMQAPGNAKELWDSLWPSGRKLWMSRNPVFDPKHPDRWWQDFRERGFVVCPQGHMHRVDNPPTCGLHDIPLTGTKRSHLVGVELLRAIHSTRAFYANADTPVGKLDLYFEGEEGRIFVMRIKSIKEGKARIWAEPKGHHH